MQNHGPVSVDALLDLVGQVYATALEPGRTTGMLDALGGCLGAVATQVYTYHKHSGVVLDSQTNSAIDAAPNEDYVRHWGALDPRPVALAALPSGGVIRCHEAFDERFVSGNSFYQDFFIPYGFRWAIGGMFHSADGSSTVVAGMRAPDRPAFEPWSGELLTRLLPHVQRAGALRAQMQAQQAAALDLSGLLAALPAACMVLDGHGRMLGTNAPGGAALATLAVRLVGAYLRFADVPTAQRWQATLRQVAAGGPAGTVGLRAPNGAPWRAQIVRWNLLGRAADATERGYLLVTLEPAVRPAASQLERLSAEAGLTSAESAVLTLLAQGRPAKVVASLRNCSVHTVRSQIASILEKAGCRSQLELLGRIG